MTTNQNIDGVPRELLEKMWRSCNGMQWQSVADEIKTILDADVCLHDWFKSEINSIPDYCTLCGIEKPAAQPQGEPVVWTEVDVLDFMSVALRHAEYSGLAPSDILDGLRYMAEKGKPAFYRAEQPAPVAVESLEIVGRQCFPSETMKKIPNYRTEPWVDGDAHQSPSVPDLYRVEPLVRLSDVIRLNTK